MLLLLLIYVVLRALWKIDVYLISTLVNKSLYYYYYRTMFFASFFFLRCWRSIISLEAVICVLPNEIHLTNVQGVILQILV